MDNAEPPGDLSVVAAPGWNATCPVKPPDPARLQDQELRVIEHRKLFIGGQMVAPTQRTHD